MAQVTRSVLLAADPETVWAAIGGFQALADWHPAVASASKEMIQGTEHRRLALEGGGEILERFLGADSRSYAYAILEPGPLPVRDYRAILSAAEAGEGRSVITWASVFGTPSLEGREAIAQVYEAGLAALKTRFG